MRQHAPNFRMLHGHGHGRRPRPRIPRPRRRFFDRSRRSSGAAVSPRVRGPGGVARPHDADLASSGWAWRPGCSPVADASLAAVLASGLLRHGRVDGLAARIAGRIAPGGRAGPGSACPWSRDPPGSFLVALVGLRRRGSEADPGWGPPCPDRALRAWGQVARRRAPGRDVRVEAGQRRRSPFRGEGGDRLLIGPPDPEAPGLRPSRAVPEPGASVALRSALKVEAVAWVPIHSDESSRSRSSARWRG